MTSKEWYKAILERNVTAQVDFEGKLTPFPLKPERLHPLLDWERSWSYLSIRGLSGVQRSFLFRLLHNLLPTRSRLHRMNLTEDPYCDICPQRIEQDTIHCFLQCSFNFIINDWIIAVLYDLNPNLLQIELTSLDIVKLNLETDDESRLPILWFLSVSLSLLWKSRISKRPISLQSLRATPILTGPTKGKE